ncbi:MAG: L-threonylcarbamoyladenylate synthase [Burkholderiales bacterium]|jgi:tRNA threonylcarbamoyl adenosine modification protein (Sua5/YciO/YrdC/YwlC family)
MAQFLRIHPGNPQARLVRQAVEILRSGGLLVYPTDSCYALGCQIGNKDALERLRRVRDVDEAHHFTLVCSSLSEISHYATVDNVQYRLLRMATPGSYTFILRASRDVPKRLLHARRKTIGLRVPDHPVVSALLDELGEPILSSTLILPGEQLPPPDIEEVRDELEHKVDMIIDSGSCGLEMTTVIDLTSDTPELIRAGKGSLEPFGLEGVG